MPSFLFISCPFRVSLKDTDIVSYEVFKTIKASLEKQRITQGYGSLYNLKLEGETEGEKLSLMEFLNEVEDPEKLITYEINIKI